MAKPSLSGNRADAASATIGRIRGSGEETTPDASNLSPASRQILVVEDFEPYRTFITSLLREKPNLRVICEAADGLEAVAKAQQLSPDLILMDIGLPRLNGIEAARQIREFAPTSKILFLTQETSAEIVQEVLQLGAWGYVIKSRAGNDLSAAIDAVLRDEQFVSNGLPHSGAIAEGPDRSD
jgi:DNA-binding NarL/FixJ family response regulator